MLRHNCIPDWLRRAPPPAAPGCNTSFTRMLYYLAMWYPRAVDRFPADFLAFEAARAGCALACPYSSSDEFEAAIIRSKLDAGVYGPKRRRRHLLYAGIAAGALILVLLML